MIAGIANNAAHHRRVVIFKPAAQPISEQLLSHSGNERVGMLQQRPPQTRDAIKRRAVVKGACSIDHWTALLVTCAPEIDAAGALNDGTTFDGVAGLRRALLKHPDAFVSTM